jgi:hypothetical protein
MMVVELKRWEPVVEMELVEKDAGPRRQPLEEVGSTEK